MTLNLEAILKNPLQTEVSNDPSVQHALVSALAQETTEDNIENILIYVCRFPKEMQGVFFKALLDSKPSLIKHKVVLDWVTVASTWIMMD